MTGVNKVILIGHLGQDPQKRQFEDGKPVANISVATSEKWTDKNTGQKTEKTEWHRVVFFGRLAEVVGQYLTKGSKVYIEGKLQTRKWTDENGMDRYNTEIVANHMQMLGGELRTNVNPLVGGFIQSDQPISRYNENGTQKSNLGMAGNVVPPPSDVFEDDEIPF